MTGRQTRTERAATPLARDSIGKIAESAGGCLRPVQLRRTDTVTGETVPVMVPCGVTPASICPPCAERAKRLRAAQCREGWHLEDEPDLTPGPPNEKQEFCLILRAEAQLRRDVAAASGEDTSDYDQLIDELDIGVTRAGIRGTVTTRRSGDGSQRGRRSRSTRRRQDYHGAGDHVITPYKGRNKPASQKAANRAHAKLRGPGERANAQLKTWRILRKLRCCPWKAGQLAKAIHVLQTRENEG
jgi:replication initiator protein RepSA/DDE superfamily endonuclease